jgi:predicted nucleotidyltransferase
MRIDDKMLATIVSRVREVARPDRILLFGSAARGEIGADSDVDLLILESEPRDVRKESVRIRDALRGLGVPIDVIVMQTARYEQSKEVFGGVAYPAHKHGKVLYAAA